MSQTCRIHLRRKGEHKLGLKLRGVPSLASAQPLLAPFKYPTQQGHFSLAEYLTKINNDASDWLKTPDVASHKHEAGSSLTQGWKICSPVQSGEPVELD